MQSKSKQHIWKDENGLEAGLSLMRNELALTSNPLLECPESMGTLSR